MQLYLWRDVSHNQSILYIVKNVGHASILPMYNVSDQLTEFIFIVLVPKVSIQVYYIQVFSKSYHLEKSWSWKISSA